MLMQHSGSLRQPDEVPSPGRPHRDAIGNELERFLCFQCVAQIPATFDPRMKPAPTSATRETWEGQTMRVSRDDDGQELSGLLLFHSLEASKARFTDDNDVTYSAVIFTFLDESGNKQELLVLRGGLERLLHLIEESVPPEG